MKEYTNVESQINKSFKDYNPKVDAQFIWDNVEQELPKGPKPYTRIFFWMFICVGLIFGVLFFDIDMVGKTTSVISQEEVETNNQTPDPELRKGHTKNFETDKSKKEDIALIHEQIQSTGGNKDLSTNGKKNQKELKSGNVLKGANQGSNYPNTQLVKDNEGEDQVRIPQIHPSLNDTLAYSSSNAKNANDLLELYPIAFLNPRLVVDRVNHFITANISKSDNPADKTYSKNSFVKIGIGAALSQPIYSVSDPINDDLKEKRSEAESDLYQLNFGIEYGYAFSEKFAISLGINYWIAQRKSIHEVTTSSSQQEIIGLVTTRKLQRLARYGRDISLSVPLRLYYNLVNTNKYQFALGLGYEHSVWGRHTGYELLLNRMEYSIGQDTESYYRSMSGHFGLLDAVFSQRLNQQLSIDVALSTKYSLSSMNTTDALVAREHNFFGIRIGTTVNF